MKRLILILLFFTFNTPICISQHCLADYNMKGRVKSVYEVTYKTGKEFDKLSTTKDKKEMESNALKLSLKFSGTGNLTSESRYKPDGNIYDSWLYIYNETDTQKEKYFYKSDGHLYLQYINTYDDKGNLIEKNIYNIYENLEQKNIFKYDDKGNRNEEIHYKFDMNEKPDEIWKNTPDENIDKKFIYKYDDAKHLIEEVLRDKDGNLHFKHIYTYDEAGNKTEEFHYNSNGKIDKKYICKYDSTGKKIEESLYNSDVLNVQYTYRYDAEENLIGDTKLEYKPDGSISFKQDNKYKLDNSKNWVLKTVYENEKPRFVVERKITYFQF